MRGNSDDFNNAINKIIYSNNWAIVTPLANEEAEFSDYVQALKAILDFLSSGKVYLVVDNASKDDTLHLCRILSASDKRFITVYAPENRNVVDAYLRGLREAYLAGHEYIIEMDAGLSHDPRAIPMFLGVLNEGNDCVFGSRFINGGSMGNSPLGRRLLSKIGTVLANTLLGTRLRDMTSGYQGFHRDIVGKIIQYPFLSKAHFYQTELRYLLRNQRIFEVPIHYNAPSPSVSKGAVINSIETLLYYFRQRLIGKSPKV